MIEILSGAKVLTIGIAVVSVVVFIAMMVDLVAGLYKASLRGEMRRSEALKRTGYKFALYEGTIIIAACVDLLIHIAKFPLWFGWDIVYGIPLVTIVLGIFWCVVEFLSVREKADEKVHSNIHKAEQLATVILKIIEAARRGESIKPEEFGIHLNEDGNDIDPISNGEL